MNFKKQDLKDMAWGDHDPERFEVVKRELVDTTRWSHHYEMVFRFEEKLYITHYSVGATECQDEEPYEFENDEIECVEVEAFHKTVLDYREVG